MAFLFIIVIYILIRVTVYPDVYKTLFPFGAACVVITAIFGMTYYIEWANFFASLSFLSLTLLVIENIVKPAN